MKITNHLLRVIMPELRTPVVFELLLTLLIGLITGGYITIAQPELPIFYSLPMTEQVIQPKIWLLIIPTASVLISVITISVIFLLSHIGSSLMKLYAWASFSSQVILFMAAIRIIYITH